ncbi:MAG: hypothetical protein GF353_15660 [Candidatus Lokiarchaeota archaeon]|nr:hypothetical protein [Candidatus Lokiarchaeota archaeon]
MKAIYFFIILLVSSDFANAFYLDEFRRIEDRDIGVKFSFSYQFSSFRQIDFENQSLPLDFPVFFLDVGFLKQINPFLTLDFSLGGFYGTGNNTTRIHKQYDLLTVSKTYGYLASVSVIPYVLRYKLLSIFLDFSHDFGQIYEQIDGMTTYSGHDVQIMNRNHKEFVFNIVPSINIGLKIKSRSEISFSLFYLKADMFSLKEFHESDLHDYNIRSGAGISIKYYNWFLGR